MVELTVEEAIALLRNEEDKLRELEMQRQQLLLVLQELGIAKSSLDVIPDKKGNALMPVGGGVFLPVEAGGSKVIVNVGAGVVVEETVVEALELINKREEMITNSMSELNAEFEKISTQAQNLSEKIRQRIARQQQTDMPVIG
jgi:prefoldin alpha subunit